MQRLKCSALIPNLVIFTTQREQYYMLHYSNVWCIHLFVMWLMPRNKTQSSALSYLIDELQKRLDFYQTGYRLVWYVVFRVYYPVYFSNLLPNYPAWPFIKLILYWAYKGFYQWFLHCLAHQLLKVWLAKQCKNHSLLTRHVGTWLKALFMKNLNM